MPVWVQTLTANNYGLHKDGVQFLLRWSHMTLLHDEISLIETPDLQLSEGQALRRKTALNQVFDE